jgi:ABC-type multidrug transport system fused ATPase/permease subunit
MVRDIELKVDRKIQVITFIEDLVREITNVISQIWLIVLVAGHKLSLSQYLFSMGLASQAINATWQVSYSIRSIQEGVTAGRAGKAVIDLKPIRKVGVAKIPTLDQGVAIDLNNVYFAYKNGIDVLKDINLSIKPGERVAIVGENGAGKSSLLKLIYGQYLNQKGSVEIDGLAVDDYDKESLYDQTSTLMQEYKLFDFLSIRQNIEIVRNKKLIDGEIDDILGLAGLEHLAAKLPKGLDTRLDSSFKDGVALSGGQRQRLAIARSFAKKSRLLILDEPTSSVDAKAEKRIFENIFNQHGYSTVIIVSHRFSTVRKADSIIVLQNGEIIEQGSHAHLMQLNGHYSELYNLQAKDYQG